VFLLLVLSLLWSAMRENILRALWQRDEYAVNGWLRLPATFSAEVMAHQGWDSLTIDLQHGLIDYETAVGMLQAISTTRTVPLVRVPWLEPGIIMKVLDAGAYGVICPMINSAAEGREFVAACRYPPAGIRSCGPTRANIYGGPDYIANANRTIVTMAMIETRSGLDSLDEILSIEGLDAIPIRTLITGSWSLTRFNRRVRHPVSVWTTATFKPSSSEGLGGTPLLIASTKAFQGLVIGTTSTKVVREN